MYDLTRIYETLGLASKGQQRLDANDTYFLNRQVEVVRSKVYEVQYLELIGRSLLPVAADIPNWASYVVEIVYDDTGRAKAIGNNADDLPRVDGNASEQSYKVVQLGDAYGWSLQDMRQAVALGVPLGDRKARMARRALETAVDEILCTGNLTSVGQTLNLKGFANHSSVPVVTSVANGQSWQDLNPDKIYADLVLLYNSVRLNTVGLFKATTIVLAQREYTAASTTRVSTFDSRSVLEMFKANFPGVEVLEWTRLADLVTAGTNRQIAYAKTPDVVEAIVPQEFEQLPPQLRNLETITNCLMRCGGVRVHHPKAIAYMDLDASST